MERNFITITQTDIDTKLAENINSRELELMSYDFERENHEAAIAALGDIAWDADTSPYRGLARDAMIIRAQKDGKDSDFIKQLADLTALDSHKANLEAVKLETAKSERNYDMLLTKLPEGAARDVAITALTEKQQAAAEKAIT